MTNTNYTLSDETGLYNFSAPTPPQEIVNLAISILDKDMRHSDVMSSPDITKDYLKLRLKEYEHEVFACLFLDNRHRVLAFDEMFRGTINGTAVYPREIVKAALRHNAAAVVLAHNHPSGIADPSSADEVITARIKDALELMDVRTLDHIVIAGNDSVSFSERGLL